MRSLARAFIVFLCVAAVPLHARACPVTDGRDLVRDMGLEPLLQTLSGAMLDSFISKFSGSIGGQRQHLTKAAHQSFAPDLLLASVRAELAGRLPVAVCKDFYEFLDSPLGKRVIELENASASPEAQQVIIRNAGKLRNSLSDRRTTLLKRLVTASGGIDAQVTLVTASLKGMVRGMKAAGLATMDSDKRVNAVLEQAEAEQRKLIGRYLRPQLAYTYQHLSDDELEAYVQVLETDAGRAVYKASVGSIDAALQTSGFVLGAKLTEMASQPRQESH